MRHALVIGNTDGIGLALTRRLLADGWAVTGLSRRPAAVEHDRYVHVAADVTARCGSVSWTRSWPRARCGR